MDKYIGHVIEVYSIVSVAKHQESMRLYEWMSQAKRDAEAGGEGRLPAVFHKKNNAPILVTMELDDFMDVYREYASDILLKEREKNNENQT